MAADLHPAAIDPARGRRPARPHARRDRRPRSGPPDEHPVDRRLVGQAADQGPPRPGQTDARPAGRNDAVAAGDARTVHRGDDHGRAMAARTAPSLAPLVGVGISNVATDELVTIRVSTGVLTIVMPERSPDARRQEGRGMSRSLLDRRDRVDVLCSPLACGGDESSDDDRDARRLRLVPRRRRRRAEPAADRARRVHRPTPASRSSCSSRRTPGTMLSKAVLTAGNPEGDVMWGVDNTLLSRAVERRRVRAVRGGRGRRPRPAEFTVARARRRGHTGRLRRRVRQLRHRRPRRGGPRSRRRRSTELAEPEYASRLVVENAATSSPGLAFLLATIAEFGDAAGSSSGPRSPTTACSSSTAGTRPTTRSFTTGRRRPAARRQLRVEPAVRGAVSPTEPLTEAPTGVVADTCFRQVEFAGVLRGTDAPDGARQLVDFLRLRAVTNARWR